MATEDSDLYEGCPEPTYVIKGNKVMCKYCGLKFSTRRKYISHFTKRHMNDDGTWRPYDHKFRIETPSADEEEAINYDIDGGRRKKNQKPWYLL